MGDFISESGFEGDGKGWEEKGKYKKIMMYFELNSWWKNKEMVRDKEKKRRND